VVPADCTLHTALGLLAGRDRWAELMPEPQPLSAVLVEEGRHIPIARVRAMHEGKRRARARREISTASEDTVRNGTPTDPGPADSAPVDPGSAE
jgi:hypothetical protein